MYREIQGEENVRLLRSDVREPFLLLRSHRSHRNIHVKFMGDS